MRPEHQIFIFTLVVICICPSVFAAGPIGGTDQAKGDGTEENPYRVPRTESAISIDAVLDEAAWQGALKFELKYEVDPGENIPASEKTEVMLLYDQHHFYAAFRCYDSDISRMVAHFSDREDIMNEDHVNLHLDTLNTNRYHTAILVSPYNNQADGIAENKEFDWSWDAIFYSAAKVHDWGYTIEIAVPFNQLRIQRSDGSQIWGFDAVRVLPRNHKHFFAVIADDRDINCYQCEMVKISGFEGVDPGRDIEISPTITAVRTDSRDQLPGGEMKKEHQKADVGLTATWGMTPNILLSGTVNPDFSNIEADAKQLDINEPFALYYDEKRPFFTEGSHFIESPLIEAVYTRTLRDPVWGAKLVGKEGDNSFGAFVVRDDITNIIFPSSQNSRTTSIKEESTATAVRYRRDLGRRYSFGALATSREGDGYHNRVLGFDGALRITDKDMIEFQLMGSDTEYPDEIAAEFAQDKNAFSDSAFSLQYAHDTRSFYWEASYNKLGADFRADLGYLPKVGYESFSSTLGHKWTPVQMSWYSSIRLQGYIEYQEDSAGKELLSYRSLLFEYKGPLRSRILVICSDADETYLSETFDVRNCRVYSYAYPSGDMLLELDINYGDGIDYRNVRAADKKFNIQPKLMYRLGKHLRIELDHLYERLDVGNERLYTANISQGTFLYQFDSKTAFRAILQYIDYSYNADLYTYTIDSEKRSLFTQLLFSYQLNPRTALYLGYSDNHRANQFFDLTQENRTFFAKIGYALAL